MQCKEKFLLCEERVYNIRGATYAAGRQGVWHDNKPAVSLMPHGQCEDRKCAVPRGSYLQYEEVVQHKERVYCQY